MFASHAPAALLGLGVLHAVFGFLFFVGLVLLFIWAIKHMPAAQMKLWGWWLFGIGVVGLAFVCLASVAMLRSGPVRGMQWGADRGGMMDDDDAGVPTMMKGAVKETGDVKLP